MDDEKLSEDDWHRRFAWGHEHTCIKCGVRHRADDPDDPMVPLHEDPEEQFCDDWRTWVHKKCLREHCGAERDNHLKDVFHHLGPEMRARGIEPLPSIWPGKKPSQRK